MFKLAAILFAVAALGGITLATLHFKKKNLPLPLALLHGLVGAAGLVSLLLALLGTGFTGAPAIAFVIFIVVALGGFLLFSFHLRKRPLPSPLVIIHGLAAVVAFGILLAGIFVFKG